LTLPYFTSLPLLLQEEAALAAFATKKQWLDAESSPNTDPRSSSSSSGSSNNNEHPNSNEAAISTAQTGARIVRAVSVSGAMPGLAPAPVATVTRKRKVDGTLVHATLGPAAAAAAAAAAAVPAAGARAGLALLGAYSSDSDSDGDSDSGGSGK